MTLTPADIELLETAAAELESEANIMAEAHIFDGVWQIDNKWDQKAKDEHDRWIAQAAGLRELAKRARA